MEGRLRVLTLNTWLLRAGGWRVARDLASRFARLPGEVARTGADVVALQEVWPPDLARALTERLRAEGYPHAARGLDRGGSRLFGDGLLLVSRHPLAAVRRFTFARASAWFESWVAKGALACEVALPEGVTLHLVTAHLGVVRFDFARRTFREDDEDARRAQLAELADWLEGMAPPGPLVLAGDLNVLDRPFRDGRYLAETHADYAGLLSRLGLRDAYREHHPGDDGFTFDPATNALAARGRCREMPGERIDYVLYRGSALRAESAAVVLSDPPWLSDHYAVVVDLRVG